MMKRCMNTLLTLRHSYARASFAVKCLALSWPTGRTCEKPGGLRRRQGDHEGSVKHNNRAISQVVYMYKYQTTLLQIFVTPMQIHSSRKYNTQSQKIQYNTRRSGLTHKVRFTRLNLRDTSRNPRNSEIPHGHVHTIVRERGERMNKGEGREKKGHDQDGRDLDSRPSGATGGRAGHWWPGWCRLSQGGEGVEVEELVVVGNG